MRIAISDYDGTLKQEEHVSDEDLKAIHDWRTSGNLFGIATGRDLSMTLHETEKYGIPFDFLVCMNGCALYDGECNLLESTEIGAADVPAIVRNPASNASLHMVMMTQGLSQLCFHGTESWFIKTELPHAVIECEEAENVQHVMQISLGYTVPAEAAEWARQLNVQFAGKVVAHHNGRTIDINAAGTDKTEGIKAMIKRNGWTCAEILVIGDGGNDIGMIKAFNGYTLNHATDALKKSARCVLANLAEMLGM